MKKYSTSIILMVAVSAGCTLQEPCDTDELFSVDGQCVKCMDMPGFHINAENLCVEDTVESCGNGMLNCFAADGVLEAVCWDGNCLIQSCDEEAGYKLESGVCKLSIPVSSVDCGLKHYDCMQDGVRTADCVADSSELQEWYCSVTGCLSGYHRIDNDDAETAWMRQKCELDSVEKCGSDVDDCHTTQIGADAVACVAGKCQILSCREDLGYVRDGERCVTQDAYACGSSKIDCVNQWLSDLYHNASLQKASTPVCDKENDRCVLSTCKDGYMKVTCDAYNNYYSNAFEPALSIPGCDSISSDVCIPDLCPGVSNKTSDDDNDGVINCLDACPMNPTKSDKSLWWDEELSVGKRCNIRDTDGDGVDDNEDYCPTRFDIKTTQDLLDKGLCDNDVCPELSAVKSFSEEESAKLCGIYVDGDKVDIPEIHIYHAKDLEFVKQKLLSIHNHLACSGADSCGDNGTSASICTSGLVYSYTCASCSVNNNKANCNKKSIIPIQTQIRVYLEQSINLYDGVETVFTVPDLENKRECYSVFYSPIAHMTAAEFDGKGHTISYLYQPNASASAQRCYLMDALFSEVALSNLKNLILDYDVIGSARSIAISSADTINVENFSINGKIHSFYSGMDGVGALAGRVTKDHSGQKTGNNAYNRFKMIRATDITIEAPNASHVGGIIGYATSVNELQAETDNIDITGYDYVGGLIGKVSAVSQYGITIMNKSVRGHDYVGGGYGHVGSFNQLGIVKNVTHTVSGNKYVGGFLGYGFDYYMEGNILLSESEYPIADLGNDPDSEKSARYINAMEEFWNLSAHHYWLYNVVSKVMGEGENVGGAIGSFSHGSGYAWFGNVYNQVNAVAGSENVGGLIGRSDSIGNVQFGNIYNQVGEISGKTNIGGLDGYMDYGFWFTFTNVINRIDTIISSENAGGFIGGVQSLSRLTNFADIFNKVTSITGKFRVAGFFSYAVSNNEIKSFLNFKKIHSQVDEIKGEREVSALISSLAYVGDKNYSFVDLSVLANINSSEATSGVLAGYDYQSANSLSFERVFSGVSIYNLSSRQCTNLFSSSMNEGINPIYDADALYIYSNCTEGSLWTYGPVSMVPQLNADMLYSTLFKNYHWYQSDFVFDDTKVALPAVFTDDALPRPLSEEDRLIVKELSDRLKTFDEE